MLRTLDQGLTWQRLPNTPGGYFTTGAFPDMDSLFLVTGSGPAKMYRSTDGGQSWAATTMPISYARRLAFFEGARRGLLVGNDGVVARTLDGGQTWQAGTSGTTANLMNVAWADAQTAFATSQNNIFKSTDAGATWQPLTTRPTAASYGVIGFATPAIGFVQGGSSLYRTADGGPTWTQLPGTHNSRVIRFITPAIGWTNSHVTQDSGHTWTELPYQPSGLLAPIDADNAYTASQMQGNVISGSSRVQRYSRRFLRAAPLANTTLSTGSTHAVAFAMEG